MPQFPETWYAPVIDPTDPTSVPQSGPRTPLVAPLRPDRRGRLRGRRMLRALAARRPVLGHFCYSDRTLRRLERADPLGLRLAAQAGVASCITMDTPLYAFMTPAQGERAWAQHAHRLHASLDAFPRAGVDPVPLVKGLAPAHWLAQLATLRELGVPRAAFYARELLLEGRPDLVQGFVRAAHRHGVHPLLLGAFTRHAAAWGRSTLAAHHHHVLARRHEFLLPHGTRRRLAGPEWSDLLRRWVGPADLGGLSTHNFLRARHLLRPGARLERFAGG